MYPTKLKINTGRFGSTAEEEERQILEDKTAKNTNRATKSLVRCLIEYLIAKELPELSKIANDDLPKYLKTSTIICIKLCIISNLNTYFKSNRKLDIISDPRFVASIEMFKGMTVQAKNLDVVAGSPPS